MSGTTETGKPISLEICIDNLESAENAVVGGADRLEVCSSLQLGGLTPSVGFVSVLRMKYPDIPLYCMIRHRNGNFVYNEDEMSAHVEDVEWLRKAGASGFVFGALTEAGGLDRTACQSIIETARPLPVTLHRAIDVANDWKNCIEDAIDIGFKAILTSGQEASALDGVYIIREMQETFKNKIDVLAGCGVNSSNVANLVDWTKCQWYHASASVPKKNVTMNKVSMGKQDNQPLRVTSVEEVKMLKETMGPA